MRAMNGQNQADRNGETPLTTRDLKVLAALETWGVLGVGQLHGLIETGAPEEEKVRLFFNETGRRVYETRLFKRLRALESRGLLKSHYFVNHRKVYTLAERGHEMLKRRGLARLPGYRDSIDESLVDHELTAAAAGLVMTELLGLTVRTERERFQWTGRGGRSPAPERGISDLWIADRLHPAAVEIEMHQKSERRYEDIFEAYRRRLPATGVVLYLTAWPAGPITILRHAQKFRAPFVHACALSEFRRQAGRAHFMGAADDAFPIALSARGERDLSAVAA